MKRGKILKRALKTINGQRQDSYGSPEDSFKIIGEYWTTYLKAQGVIPSEGSEVKIQPKEVAEMMVLFKVARMSGQEFTADNYVDGAGYIAIAADLGSK